MGKKIKGRKRHIVTDTQGHLLHVKVNAANTHDTVSECEVFEEAIKKYPTLKGVWADARYRKTMEEFVDKVLKKTFESSEGAFNSACGPSNIAAVTLKGDAQMLYK